MKSDTDPKATELLTELLQALKDFRGDYDAAKKFSEEWDTRLGFNKPEIEKLLEKRSPPDGEVAWFGLPLPSLETPYPEIYRAWVQLLSDLPPQFRCVDLGAAYGRVALVQLTLFPNSSFEGYELVSERAEEGNRIFDRLGMGPSTPYGMSQSKGRAHLRCTNLAEIGTLPEADVYFIYDLGSVERIRHMLALIQHRARERGLIVIGRGRATRHLIETENAWLSQVHASVHLENLSLYFSAARAPQTG